MKRNIKTFISFLVLAALTSCAMFSERQTEVRIEGGKQPDFIFSGSGDLGSLTVIDTSLRDDPKFPDNYIWQIEPANGMLESRPVEDIKSIKYGIVPRGYKQMIPAEGTPPPQLVEGRHYLYIPDTINAGFAPGGFEIKDGKSVQFSGRK